MAEAFGLHQPRDADRSDARDPAHVVSAEVNEHGVLCALLRIRAQFTLESRVFVGRSAPRTRAGDGADGHLACLDLNEQLGGSAEQLAAPEAQVEMVRRGRSRPKRAVERKAVAVGQLEALREDHLKYVARADVLERPSDRRLVGALSASDGPRLRQLRAAPPRVARASGFT